MTTNNIDEITVDELSRSILESLEREEAIIIVERPSQVNKYEDTKSELGKALRKGRMKRKKK